MHNGFTERRLHTVREMALGNPSFILYLKKYRIDLTETWQESASGSNVQRSKVLHQSNNFISQNIERGYQGM